MNKNFLHINDLNAEEFHEIIEIAKWIKEKFKNEDNYSPLLNKTMAMIFAKPSARTRISFETGFFRLGGHALFLGSPFFAALRPGLRSSSARTALGKPARILARARERKRG